MTELTRIPIRLPIDTPIKSTSEGSQGIPFVLKIWGTPIDPGWAAVKITALQLGTATVIDGFAALGDRYVSAFLNELGSPNLLTSLARESYTDAQRTFNVPPWLEAPYVHVLTAGRTTCDAVLEEAALQIDYGAAQALVLDGTKTYTYDLTDFDFNINETGAKFVIIGNGRWTNLGASETLFSLFSSISTTDFITLSKRATNVVRATLYVDGVASGGGAAPGHDFDVAQQGGINTDGWFALSVIVGPALGNISLVCRANWNGVNVSATQTIPRTAVDVEWANHIDRLIVGALPDATTEIANGRANRLVLLKGVDLTDEIWDAVRALEVDPAVEFLRGARYLDLCGRTPWGFRNRENGQLYIDHTGTPAVVSSAVDSPVDCLHRALEMQITVPATGTNLAYYIPEADGIYLLYTAPGHDTENITVGFDGDTDSAQVVTGPRAVIAGGGSLLNIASNGASAFAAWLVPLLSSKGP